MENIASDYGLVGLLISSIIGGGGWLVKYLISENQKNIERFLEVNNKSMEIQQETNTILKDFDSSIKGLNQSNKDLRETMVVIISIIEDNQKILEETIIEKGGYNSPSLKKTNKTIQSLKDKVASTNIPLSETPNLFKKAGN